MLRNILVVAAAIVLSTGVPMTRSAALVTEQPAHTSKSGDRTTMYTVSQSKLVIDSKGPDYFLFCKRRFEIRPDTVIKDEMGTEITFEKVSISCSVKASFYKKPGGENTYVAVSIEVLGQPTPRPE